MEAAGDEKGGDLALAIGFVLGLGAAQGHLRLEFQSFRLQPDGAVVGAGDVGEDVAFPLSSNIRKRRRMGARALCQALCGLATCWRMEFLLAKVRRACFSRATL